MAADGVSKGPLAYLQGLQGCPPAFQASADVLLVVEGLELPAHSQWLARYCGFFADMFASLNDAPAAGGSSGAGGGGSASPVFSSAAPLRLEAPFQGTQLQHAQLFLHSLYRPDELAAFAASPEIASPSAFSGVYELADKLDHSLLLGALKAHLEKASAVADEVLLKDPLGWIDFADRFGLSTLHARCVSLLLRQLANAANGKQLVRALDWGKADQRLLLQLLDSLLSGVYGLQAIGWTSTASNLAARLPDAASLAAWSAMGDALPK